MSNSIINKILGKGKKKEKEQKSESNKGGSKEGLKSPRSSQDGEQISESQIESNQGQYYVYEIFKVQIPSKQQSQKMYDMKIQVFDETNSSSWAIDGMLIDEELLYAEDAEADRIYSELKARSFRRRNMEEKENRLSMSMMKEQTVEEEQETQASDQYKMGQTSQSFEKIKNFLKRSPPIEKLEFTQGLLNFANKIEKRFLIEGLLPALKLLANENPDIKRALLDQFIPLITYIREQCGQEGYDKTVQAIFPLLDLLLYDQREQIRDKSIQVLVDIRNYVQQKENDHILNLTLKLAHDDLEQNRVSSLKILNELAADMGQTLCQSFIVPEIRSLGQDETSSVRQSVARNLLNISKIVSINYFTDSIFPLYDKLAQDKDEKVRKTCAEVVAEIAQVSPLDKKAQALSDLYFRFLKDPTSKIVRGTAFQNIGPFIAALKETKQIDSRIVDFYVTTTENSNNKDVCYYSSFNFPAFIYVLEKDCWPQFKKIYFKLARFNDARIKRTLSHSIHELAHILGPEITEQDLVPILEKFLKDPINEIKVGALKNLHIFLKEVQPENRHKFIKCIVTTYNEAGNDWRTKLVIAQNFGKYAQLFDKDIVYNDFIPMFFKFCYDQVNKVCEAASHSLVYILEKFNDDNQKQDSIVKVVKKNFLNSRNYKQRQLFILMCGEAMMNKSLFEREFKADMLRLVKDPVSNVRLNLSKVLRNHFLNQISGPFVFDEEVNDAVRILKRDTSRDVREIVEDIQTFPMNEEREVSIEDFFKKLDHLKIKISENEQQQEEEEKQIEKDIQIDSIIEESKATRKTNPDQQTIRTSIAEQEMNEMQTMDEGKFSIIDEDFKDKLADSLEIANQNNNQ